MIYKPRLYSAPTIRGDPSLTKIIISIVNEGYRHEDLERWEGSKPRLATPSALFNEIGHDGLFAVLYDPQDDITPIACAAARKWTVDREGYAAHGEKGWELVTVTTHPNWLRRGLAARCVNAVVEELVNQARNNEKWETGEKLQIWAQSVECKTGAFWRKQEWVEVRSYEKPVGHWGSKCGYRLLVLLKEYDVG